MKKKEIKTEEITLKKEWGKNLKGSKVKVTEATKKRLEKAKMI